MARLLDHNVPVKVELNIQTQDRTEDASTPNGFNIVGEIPGTDKADEIVLIGAHFDSWQGATGATDNAAGSAAMMEVLRILKATGPCAAADGSHRAVGRRGRRPASDRATYVTRASRHGAARRCPSWRRPSVYFNLDNGTGPIRGIWMQGNTARRADLQGVDRAAEGSRRRDPRPAVSEPDGPHVVRQPSACPRFSSCRSATSTTRARTTRTWTSSTACSRTT